MQSLPLVRAYLNPGSRVLLAPVVLSGLTLLLLLPGLLSELLSLHASLHVRIELLLRLLIRRLEPPRLDVTLLRCKITRSFCAHDRITPSAEGSCANGLRLLLRTCNPRLSGSFTLFNVDDILHVRRHKGLLRLWASSQIKVALTCTSSLSTKAKTTKTTKSG